MGHNIATSVKRHSLEDLYAIIDRLEKGRERGLV
jgi:hypothetical protein